MKSVLLSLFAAFVLLFSVSLNAQTYIDEDFTTFLDSISPPIASGWKNTDSSAAQTNQIWRFDNPNPRNAQSPIAGKFAILDSDWYPANGSQDAILSSPNFDASLATTVLLEFDYIHIGYISDTSTVEVFDGTNWVVVGNYSNLTLGTAFNPLTQSVSIDISNEAAGVPNAQIRFRYIGSFQYYWGIDNVKVFQPQPDDLAAVSVDSLISGCNLDSVQVKATIVNFGTTTINSYDLNYTVNGGTPVTESLSTPLLPGDTLRYTFNKQAVVSAVGSYDIQVYTFTRNDINNANDSATGTVTNLNVVNTFPYTEGFENGNGDWISGGSNSTWQNGAPAGLIINSAASGTQAYVTNLTGDYNNNEQSFVISPCFDFTNLSQPQIKVNIWVESENNWDGTILQSSINGGLTWQTVGALNDPVNWYNGTANAIGGATSSNECWTASSPFGPPIGWVLAERDLTGLAGQPSVRLRFFHATDGSVQEEGFAFDNILIQDAPSTDAAIVDIVRPTTGCNLTSADSVEIRIFNPGSAAISNFGVSYVLNAGTPVNETFTGTIIPGDTVNYVFSATANLGTAGTYGLRAYSSLTGDANPLNDTLNRVVENIPVISSFPYNEGFETSNGGWVSGGTANSWQWGAPAGTIINTAAAGTQAWVTNLSGTYNNNEVSYVESPCFDFSSLSQPQIQFSLWLDNESGFDGTVLEASINGGQSWVKIGALNDPVNWYNDNTFNIGQQTSNQDCWSDASPFSAAPGWVIASHALNGLAGQPSVRLRFLHVTDGSVVDEGFGFDEIVIQDAPSNDAEVISIVGPESGCGLTATDTIKVLLTNVGSAPIDTLPLAFSVNASNFILDTNFAIINPGDTVLFAFDTSYDFSLGGSYNVFVQASLSSDPNLFNDTTSAVITNTINTLVTAPFTENFDGTGFTAGTGGGNVGSTLGNGWIANPAGSPDFFWGTRNTATGSGGTGPDVDHTSGTGNFIYVEGSNGPTGAIAELYSPCIDLTALTAPTLEFWYHKFGTSMATMYVDVFDGNDWVVVDSIVGQTQFANTDPYLKRTIGLNSFSGTIQVRFRSGPKTGFSTDMAIDDFRVFEPSATDAGISIVNSPSSGCGLGAADSVRVTIINAGSNQLDTVPLAYTVNFSGLVVDTSFAPIAPNSSVTFTFSTTVNLSATGNYFIDAFTTLAGDFNTSNDTASATVINEPVVSFPYFEDFESSNGGWTVTGTNASWAWGTPTAFYIDSAGSGNNSWVTNLSGPYNNSELSYIESPCIDLRTLVNDPTLVFQHIYETEDSYDEGWVELSTDAGQNWTKIVSSPVALNWYNDQVNQWWEDTSAAGATNWQVASNDLLGAAGNTVKIRFAMSSDGSVIFEGFGVDSVSIDLFTGLNTQIKATDQLSIFPNPSTGQFILRSELGEEYDVLILSSGGKVVYDHRLSFNTSRDYMIDLSEQPKGMYFIRLLNGEEMITKKVIIQ